MTQRCALEKSVEVDPEFAFGYTLLASGYFSLGREAAGVEARLSSLRYSGVPEETIAGIRRAHAEAGLQGFQRAQLEWLRERAATERVPAFQVRLAPRGTTASSPGSVPIPASSICCAASGCLVEPHLEPPN